MDYRKAFNFVSHVKIFNILINRNIDIIFIRQMIFIYLSQSCYIEWQQMRSYSFSITNWSLQGAVFSRQGGFTAYLDPKFQSLRESGHGLKIGEFGYGGLAFVPEGKATISHIRDMVEICAKHA